MGLARTLAVALTGVDGQLVEVECDIAPGLPGLSLPACRTRRSTSRATGCALP